jgi:bacterioferritin
MVAQKRVALLNCLLEHELQAVHQYMYWHFHLKHQGLAPLADFLRGVAIMEMRHVESLAERILFLRGDIRMMLAGPVKKTTDPMTVLSQGAEMERTVIDVYDQCALECDTSVYAAIKKFCESMKADEEGHLREFDNLLDNISRYGYRAASWSSRLVSTRVD